MRSTRPPQPAWLSRGAGGIEVDLVAGEDGVSPGQACVLYDAAEGQARVLGGGFIASAVPAQLPQAPEARVARASSDVRGVMADEIDKSTVAKAYARWAPVYDLVFGAVFDAGRKASIAAAERIGGRILDVGIGTGISLADYSAKNCIVGVDYSEPMLRKARERVTAHALAHVEALAVMDAQWLGFPDAFFDAVVAQYVITTVPNPEAALDEFARVTRPGGEIILVNHLGAEAGFRRLFEQGFAPIARRLGWRPEFRWQRIAQWAECHGGIGVVERRPMPPLGHFSLIRLVRLAPGAIGQRRAAADGSSAFTGRPQRTI